MCQVCGSVLPKGQFTQWGWKNRICRTCEEQWVRASWWDAAEFSSPVGLPLLMEWPPDSVVYHPPSDCSAPQRPGAGPRAASRRQATEDLLLLLLYLSAVRYEELDRARCAKHILHDTLERLQEAGLITIHKKCIRFTLEGEDIAQNLLTEFGLDRLDT